MNKFDSSSAREIFLDIADRESTGTAIAERIQAEAERGVYSGEVEKQLINSANDIKEVVGGIRTKKLEGNVAGMAMQGEAGSSVIDVTSVLRQETSLTGILDINSLKDVVAHEHEHEAQAREWNAESVRILGMNRELTRRDISETGAMSVQATIQNNSADYRSMWDFVTSKVSANDAKETARTGDLIGLAEKINGASESQAA